MREVRPCRIRCAGTIAVSIILHRYPIVPILDYPIAGVDICVQIGSILLGLAGWSNGSSFFSGAAQ